MLPVELLDQIILHLLGTDRCTIQDVVCLAATCYDGWVVVKPHICTWAAQASWAGGRLVCFEEHMEMSALPSGLLDDTEHAEFAAARPEDCMDGIVSPYHYAYGRFSDAYTSDHDARSAYIINDLQLHRCVVGTPMKAIEALLEPPCTVPLSGAIVLRNLSKKLFVRQGAIDNLDEEVPDQAHDFYHLTLGHAVTARIGCSSSLEDDDNRGAWAGDRFDIVPEVVLRACADYEEWQDVSEEICDGMRKICGA
jgi:hypothetical protein